MLVSLSIHPAFPLPRLFTAVVRPAGGTDKTGGRVPLGLNHAPANGTNYRIFHGIRYLRCVVRAVRAAAGQPLLYVPSASVLRIYRHVSDTKRLLRNRSFSNNHSRLFLSAPPSSDTPTAQAVARMRRTAVICSAYFRVSPPAAPEVPLGTRADRCPSSIGLLLQPVGRAPDGLHPSRGAAPTEKSKVNTLCQAGTMGLRRAGATRLAS